MLILSPCHCQSTKRIVQNSLKLFHISVSRGMWKDVSLTDYSNYMVIHCKCYFLVAYHR